MASYNDAKLNGWNSGADSSTNQAMELFTEAVVSQKSDKVTSTSAGDIAPRQQQRPHVSIVGNRWYLKGQVTYPDAQAEGLLMNGRMVNAVFEDRNCFDFDTEANTDQLSPKFPTMPHTGFVRSPSASKAVCPVVRELSTSLSTRTVHCEGIASNAAARY